MISEIRKWVMSAFAGVPRADWGLSEHAGTGTVHAWLINRYSETHARYSWFVRKYANGYLVRVVWVYTLDKGETWTSVDRYTGGIERTEKMAALIREQSIKIRAGETPNGFRGTGGRV